MSHSILITGSSRGIGKAIALRLAKDDFDIVLHARTQSEALNQTFQTLQEAGVNVRKIVFDVTDRESAKACLEQDIAKHGMYWGVVVNAGIARDETFAGMSAQSWDCVLDTDLRSFYNVVQPLIMPFVHARRGGRIVIMSSVSGIIGNRGQVNYAAAKAGLIGAGKSLAVELASRRITVNVVAPGLIATEMVDETTLERALPAIPMRRAGKPEEVAGAVAFLMSEEAAYITRSVIEINGGLH